MIALPHRFILCRARGDAARRSGRALLLGLGLAAAGCGLQKATRPTEVLRTDDFIADPGTTPTELARTPPANPDGPRAGRPIVSAAAASDEAFNVSASIGPPPEAAAGTAAIGAPVLIDAKVGELNGRPIRAQEILNEIGPRLDAAARRQRLSRDEWVFLVFPRDPEPGVEDRTLRREEWVAFARRLIAFRLDNDLEGQLLAEEARFSLKPEQKQGLKYMVQEAAETYRRESGGGRAAAQERMRGQARPTTEREFTREREAMLLIGYELEERLRKRIRTSWKDVRLYYDRNQDQYNPPPVAHFRLIRVGADKPEAIATIQKALDAGTPFATVAAMPENEFLASSGGETPPQRFSGNYAEASFFSGGLADAAKTLQPGGYNTVPVDFGKDKAWLFLERIEQTSRPLANRDVQLEIASRLNGDAFAAEKRVYIDRLKNRASFTDIPTMATQLAAIAAARYWPKE